MWIHPARLAIASAFTILAFSPVPASQPDAADPRWAAQIQEEAKGLPGSPAVLIDGSALNDFSRQMEEGFGVSSVVDVEGQPFAKAVRVESLQRIDPEWRTQVVTQASTAAVRKGDTLLLVCFARCLDSKAESGGALATGRLQLSRLPWTSFIDFSLRPGKDWQKFYRHLRAEQDLKPGDLNLAFHFGQCAQTLEFGGVVLFDLGQNVDMAKVPVSKITYEGREPEAPWRKAALERIELYRKADFEVQVKDAAGKPVPNATVRVRMLRHAYQFGTYLEGPALWENADGQKYRETLRQFFNRVTVPLYWADWGWDNPETQKNYLKLATLAREMGMHIRGHNLVWPDWRHNPGWLRKFEDDPRRLRNLINASIAERVAVFRRFEFDDYDVINELRDNHAIVDILGDDEPAQWFKLAHSLDPNAEARHQRMRHRRRRRTHGGAAGHL
jgi:hypothetical protein